MWLVKDRLRILLNPVILRRSAYKLTWKLGSTKIHEEQLQIGQKVGVLTEKQLTLPGRQSVLGKNVSI